MRSLKLLMLVLAPLAIAFSCADPTAIEVDVFSEVPCATHAEVTFSMASSSDGLKSASTAAVSTRCDDQGDGTVRRGSVVIIPSADPSKRVAFELKTRNDDQPVDGCAIDPKKCISARRELQFISKTTLSVRVDLRLSCLGVECPSNMTCVKGSCVADTVGGGCNNSVCDENTLPGVDAGAPDTSVPDTSVPDTSVPDAALPNIVLAGGGGGHFCAINQKQQLKCWGNDSNGQLGFSNMSMVNSPTPLLVSGGLAAVKLGLGWFTSCAIDNMNQAKCWGRNTSGELGVNSAMMQFPTPTALNGYAFASIQGGNTHSCGVAPNGDLTCWGSGSNGQIGTMVGSSSLKPLNVFVSFVLGVTAGDLFTCEWTQTDARCFGANNVGQLGNGGNAQTATPTPAINLFAAGVTVTQISAGSDNSCALLSDGTVKCWGDNSSGECGDGAVGGSRSTPIAVVGLGGPMTMLAGGGPHMCGLRNDGVVLCWGNDGSGQLGDGMSTNRGTPKPVLNVTNATAIASAGSTTCAVIAGSHVVCWGANNNGQIGDGTFMPRPTATNVVGL